MTIAISLKVDDGIVLASDSATSIGDPPVQIYNNAKKIFRLHKDLPLGAVTWGLACIGRLSLKILAKDFRKELMEGSYAFDATNYTVEQVASLFKEFMFDRNYQAGNAHLPPDQQPYLEFMVAGYSSGQPRGEVWLLQFSDGMCHGPDLLMDQDTTAISWQGQPQALRRLVLGFDESDLKNVLQTEGLAPAQIDSIIQKCKNQFGISIVRDVMPIQDAIDLAIYLEQTSAGFIKFCDGPASVGGPVEVAALTKHEGFKWIKRKHFYEKALNP